MRISSRSPSYMETDVTSKARTRSAKPASAPQSGGRQQRRVAIVGGNRIPFARSDRAYAHASNQDMFTATLDGLVSRFGLQGERLGMVVGGAVLKHSRDFNLMRECVLGQRAQPLHPGLRPPAGVRHRPAVDHRRRRRHRGRRIDAGVGGGVDTTSDAPIGVNNELREFLLSMNRARSAADRVKLLGQVRPSMLGIEIPRNGEPRTGLSMGDHAAITAKEFGVRREDQDELAAASHRNMAAAYDRGFFDDLVTPFLGLTATTTCVPTRTSTSWRRSSPCSAPSWATRP